jgi:uncharacterized protein (TIGR02246 family)
MRRVQQIVIVTVAVGIFGLTLAAAQAQKAAPKAVRKEAAKGQPPKVTPDDGSAEAAIRRSAEAFATSYAAHDAKALASGFTADAEFINEDGQVISGRAAIQAHFKEIFEGLPEARIRLKVESVRQVTPDVAIEEGTAEMFLEGADDVQSSKYVALHVRKDGEWLIARARDFHGETTPVTHHKRLADLAWLIGDWVDESPEAVIHTSCRWAEGENFLLQEFSSRVGRRALINGSTRIGWDPLAGQVRSWTFDSSGGFSEGLWTRDEKGWVLKSRGVTGDGKVASATTIIRQLDANTMTWESRDRIVGDVVEENIDPIVVKRRGPAPGE